MLKVLIDAIKGLSLSEKIAGGVSLAILFNPHVAVFAAVIVVSYLIYKLGKVAYEASNNSI